ncbi:MAG: hypothetical protein Q8N13_12195 [Acidovorax sp.]|nr:hypothetical protein [Acidovorax sp.]
MPRTPTTNHPAPAPTGPEPSVDTTKRQAPATRTEGSATEAGKSSSNAQEKPKLPHERDESVDMTHGQPDAQIEQAYRDVKRGLQDTDRGPPADKAYQKQKQ